MIKILFVCHGNICRSPMAEYIMKDLVRKAGLESQFQIASAATSREELGNPVYPPASASCRAWDRLFRPRCSATPEQRLREVRPVDRDGPGKPPGYVPHLRRRLCGQDAPPAGYTDRPNQEVADPWYTDNFEATWRDVEEGCRGLLNAGKEFD